MWPGCEPAGKGGDVVSAVDREGGVSSGSDASAVLDAVASWSPWLPFGEAIVQAPRSPGVYVAREGANGPVIYVGMAGERRGAGLRGRLGVYRSGKALASGLGEAVFDRALADPVWLAERLDEVNAGRSSRAKLWGQAAFARADLHVRWSVTADRQAAVELERDCLDAMADHDLWNRLR